jgi:WD40 repeat protein
LNLVEDCERFVLGFFDVIEQSAMHIYHSALPWSPTSSPTRELYQSQMMNEVKLINAIDAYWDACLRAIPIHSTLIALAFSHNDSELGVVSKDCVKIFEIATGVATFGVDESAASITFSPDDDWLACGRKDGTVRVWDVQTSNLVQSFVGHEGTIFSIVFSPCGNMIVSGGQDMTIRIWSMSSGRCKCVLEGHSNLVSSVCMSTTVDQIVSGSWDASVRVWDVSRQTCLMILRGITLREVTSVASSSDSSLIASGSWDGTVTVYDARSGHILQTISTNDPISSVRFATQDDKLLYTNWNSATIWDLLRNRQVLTINCDGFHGAFSRDSSRVASQSDGCVKIFITADGYSNPKTIGHHSEKVNTITFSSDGRIMASRSSYEIKIWDTTSGEFLFAMDRSSYGHLSVVFSPNSAFVACRSEDFHVRVWNIHTHDLVNDMLLRVEHQRNIALSSCGGRLISLSYPTGILL